MVQIDRHFSEVSPSEMTIEKLQKIATANCDPKHKERWLRWWNSSEDARRSYRFPMKNFNADLDPWVVKAQFWAEVHS